MKRVLYLFGQLQDRDVEWMISKGKKQRLTAGATIIEEGKPLNAIYFILDGTFGIYVRAMGSKAIAESGCGEVVGEMSFVDARPPSATVKALSNALVLAISRQDFEAKLDQDTAFAARFYRSIAIFLSDRLRQRTEAQSGAKDKAEEDKEEDELDLNVLDNVHLAGARFHEVLQRLMSS